MSYLPASQIHVCICSYIVTGGVLISIDFIPNSTELGSVPVRTLLYCARPVDTRDQGDIVPNNSPRLYAKVLEAVYVSNF